MDPNSFFKWSNQRSNIFKRSHSRAPKQDDVFHKPSTTNKSSSPALDVFQLFTDPPDLPHNLIQQQKTINKRNQAYENNLRVSGHDDFKELLEQARKNKQFSQSDYILYLGLTILLISIIRK
jgi:hypothetical protein